MPFLNLLYQPFASLTLPPPSTFQNHTVLITGSNTGIGLGSAHHFLSLGASTLILGVRTLSKGLAASATLSERFPSASIHVWELNMSNFASVKAFARRAEHELDRLDTVVLNAGMASKVFNLSDDGWEMQIQVNVLSTALLGLLLLPKLERSRASAGREHTNLVVVGSDIHIDALFTERTTSPNANMLQRMNDRALWEESIKKGGAVERYAVSKLLNIYVALELARLAPRTAEGKHAVVVNVLAPGFVKSELLSREDNPPWILVLMQWLVGRSVEVGSRTLVDAAARGEEAHGVYLDHQKIASMGVLVTGKEGLKLRKRIWDEVVEVLARAAPEIRGLMGDKQN